MHRSEIAQSHTAERDITALEDIACPLCQSAKRREWGAENGYLCWKCEGCGIAYVSPRPTLAQISEANTIGEHRTADATLNVLYKRSARKTHRYARRIQRIFKDCITAGKPLSWLDVGAGYGELVEALQSALPGGSKVLGIEPMAAKVAAAQQLGLPVAQTALSDIDEKFDVVSLVNVFSHIPDFKAFLSDIVALLKPNGELYLETGNGGDLQSSNEYPDLLCLPDHLVFAGVGHLTQYLREAGFSIVSVDEQRLDTMYWSAKGLAKVILGREAKVTAPYRSPFRMVFVRARLNGHHP